MRKWLGKAWHWIEHIHTGFWVWNGVKTLAMYPAAVSILATIYAWVKGLPEWAFGLFAVISTYLVTLIVASWKNRQVERKQENHHQLFVKEPPSPDWKSYQEDTISGVLWRWEYNSSNSVERAINEGTLMALCPNCMGDMRETGGTPGLSPDRCLKCVNCNHRSKWYENGLFRFERDVIAEIKRKLRTGEYKKR